MGALEFGQELSEQLVERALLGCRQASEEVFFVRNMSLQRSVDCRLAAPREADEHTAAIVGVGPAFDQAGLNQAVEPLGHPGGGEHGRPHQVGRLELIRLAGPAQRGEKVEPTRLEAMLSKLSGQHSVGQLGHPEQAAVQAECRNADVRTLAPPLSEDLVDVVGRPVHVITPAIFSLESIFQARISAEGRCKGLC
jgi:hypothetical protein